MARLALAGQLGPAASSLARRRGRLTLALAATLASGALSCGAAVAGARSPEASPATARPRLWPASGEVVTSDRIAAKRAAAQGQPMAARGRQADRGSAADGHLDAELPASASVRGAGGSAVGATAPPLLLLRHDERRVTRVIDGDTVVLDGKTHVRLAGVNAPEIDEDLGLESRALAVRLSLHQGVKTVDVPKNDAYGRLLSDLTVDGHSLSEALVAAGLAHVYLIPPVDQRAASRLLAVQQKARAAGLGIWATARYRGVLHITSFHANPPGNDNDNLNGEYLRLANVSSAPQDLRGFALVNRKGERFVFPGGVLPPGYTVKLHSGVGVDEMRYAEQMAFYWKRTFGAWSNQGDTATLLGPDGAVVDSVTYDPSHRKVYPK